jgi:hypothetical protein
MATQHIQTKCSNSCSVATTSTNHYSSQSTFYNENVQMMEYAQTLIDILGA